MGPSPDQIAAAYPPVIKSRSDELREMTSRVTSLIRNRGYDPVAALLDSITKLALWIEQEEKADVPDKRLILDLFKEANLIHKELLQYIAPKLKSVDVTGQVDQNITVVVGLPRKAVNGALPEPKQTVELMSLRPRTN